MKKIYLLLFILTTLITRVHAQSFSLLNINNYLQGNTSVFQYELTVEVQNISSSSKDVKMRKAINNLATGHASLFCFGQYCYDENTDTAINILPMLPGEIDTARADLRTYFVPGISHVTYCWYDVNNNADSICLEFIYDILPTGIFETYNAKTDFVSFPQPNPADGSTLLFYHLNDKNAAARILVFNVVGSKVKEIELDASEQKFQLNTFVFEPGVYYYSLVSGTRIVSTRKLIVSH